LINLVARDPANGHSETLKPRTVHAAAVAQRQGCIVTAYFQLTSLLKIRAQTSAETELPDSATVPAPDASAPSTPTDATADRPVRRPPRFRRFTGLGFSNGWLWSQVVLWLIRAGYAEDAVNCLPLDAALHLARGHTAASPDQGTIPGENCAWFPPGRTVMVPGASTGSGSGDPRLGSV
jgi:hypothetical protein